jgi:MFS family permease
MSDLETRYRTVLLWYPSSWREQNADAVVGTLLDEADAAGRTQPRLTELASLAINGLVARLRGDGIMGTISRDHLATLALGAGLALTLIMFVTSEWAPWATEPNHLDPMFPAFGPFASAAVIINFLWFAAFGLMLAGFVPWGRLVLVLAGVGSIAAIVLVNETPLLYARPPASALSFLIVLAVLACSGRPTPAMGVRAAAGTAAFFTVFMFQIFALNNWSINERLFRGWHVASTGWWAVALFGLALLCLVMRRIDWVTPLSSLGLAWSLYWLGSGLVRHPDVTIFVPSMVGALAAGAAFLFAALMARRLRLVD